MSSLTMSMLHPKDKDPAFLPEYKTYRSQSAAETEMESVSVRHRVKSSADEAPKGTAHA